MFPGLDLYYTDRCCAQRIITAVGEDLDGLDRDLSDVMMGF